MATLDWPTTEEFKPQGVRWGVSAPRSAWRAFYTGQRQSVSHLADRLRCTLWLPPAWNTVQSARREAFLVSLASTGDWVRFGHFQRKVPSGTARGTMTLSGAVAAGARSIVIAGATPTVTATLLPGDVLGLGGHLLVVANTATMDGSNLLSVTLTTPAQATSASGAAVTWLQPTGQFELLTPDPAMEYGGGGLQAPMQLDFAQVVP